MWEGHLSSGPAWATYEIFTSKKAKQTSKQINQYWVLVAHTCNLSHLGGLKFKASPGKQFPRPHLQNSQSKMKWRLEM
jgi:hypothetical protein